jgi:hypothetical protein
MVESPALPSCREPYLAMSMHAPSIVSGHLGVAGTCVMRSVDQASRQLVAIMIRLLSLEVSPARDLIAVKDLVKSFHARSIASSLSGAIGLYVTLPVGQDSKSAAVTTRPMHNMVVYHVKVLSLRSRVANSRIALSTARSPHGYLLVSALSSVEVVRSAKSAKSRSKLRLAVLNVPPTSSVTSHATQSRVL